MNISNQIEDNIDSCCHSVTGSDNISYKLVLKQFPSLSFHFKASVFVCSSEFKNLYLHNLDILHTTKICFGKCNKPINTHCKRTNNESFLYSITFKNRWSSGLRKKISFDRFWFIEGLTICSPQSHSVLKLVLIKLTVLHELDI